MEDTVPNSVAANEGAVDKGTNEGAVDKGTNEGVMDKSASVALGIMLGNTEVSVGAYVCAPEG